MIMRYGYIYIYLNHATSISSVLRFVSRIYDAESYYINSSICKLNFHKPDNFKFAKGGFYWQSYRRGACDFPVNIPCEKYCATRRFYLGDLIIGAIAYRRVNHAVHRGPLYIKYPGSPVDWTSTVLFITLIMREQTLSKRGMQHQLEKRGKVTCSTTSKCCLKDIDGHTLWNSFPSE